MSVPGSSVSDDDISVAVSPVQLAAVIEGASLGEADTMSNRIWGGVGLVGGVIELLGSAALLIDPDPTISKVIGAVGLVHGADVTLASWHQLTSGSNQTTVTSQLASRLASSLGMDAKAAGITGAIVDIAVPTGLLTILARSQSVMRIARILRVRSGFISLEEEETLFQFKNAKASSHALRDHCGKSVADLMARFKSEPSLLGSSSFTSKEEAERCVSLILRSKKADISRWINSGARRPTTLRMTMSRTIGTGVINPERLSLVSHSKQVAHDVRTVAVVLARTNLNGRTWYVLTAYPDVLFELGLRR